MKIGGSSMGGTQDSPPSAPSGRQVAFATLVALTSALIILVVAILPAEYGVDPLGTGAALGLVHPDDVADGSATAAVPAVAPDAALVPTAMGAVSYYGRPYAVDRFDIELGPYEFIEYKYRLEQGASMHFTWQATGQVLHELHADPDGTDGHNPVSFDKRELASASGTHTAPFPGMHGWYWENPDATPVRITLTSTGYFSSALEYRSTGTKIRHEVEIAPGGVQGVRGVQGVQEGTGTN